MANAVGGQGFIPVGSLAGGPYNGSTVRVYYPGTTVTTGLFTGDVVEYSGNGSADGYPEVDLAAATDNPWGVIVGVEATKTNLEANYIVGGTAGYARMVPVDGNLFRIKTDDTGTLGVDGIGQTTIYTVTAGSAVTGFSGYTVSVSDVGTSIADEVRILGIIDRPDNDPALANCEVIVQFNASQTALGATGKVGV